MPIFFSFLFHVPWCAIAEEILEAYFILSHLQLTKLAVQQSLPVIMDGV